MRPEKLSTLHVRRRCDVKMEHIFRDFIAFATQLLWFVFILFIFIAGSIYLFIS